jgi:hypothetical protein
MNSSLSVWTPELIARVSKLWVDGNSFGAIVILLDYKFTRSAVGGKLKRLGLLAGNGARPACARGGPRSKKRAPRSASVKSPAATASIPCVIPEPEAVGPINAFPDGRSCRFIHGDPGAAGDWRCCGAPVAAPALWWCLAHLARVAGAQSRRIDRAAAAARRVAPGTSGFLKVFG